MTSCGKWLLKEISFMFLLFTNILTKFLLQNEHNDTDGRNFLKKDFFSFLKKLLLILLYNIVLVLPYIDLNLPWVYMCSPSWTSLPLPSPSHLSGHPSAPAPSILSHALNLGWRFVSHMIFYMFQCHSPISSHPRPLPSSKRLFNTSVSLLLSCIQGYCYLLPKFHIYDKGIMTQI